MLLPKEAMMRTRNLQNTEASSQFRTKAKQTKKEIKTQDMFVHQVPYVYGN